MSLQTFLTSEEDNINAEFGRLSHTPPNKPNRQTFWSSPRQNLGSLRWGHLRHNDSVRLEPHKVKEDTGSVPPPRHKNSLKGIFSSFRNGLFQTLSLSSSIEENSSDLQSSRRVETLNLSHTSERVDDTVNETKSGYLRRSKSLSFLGSISNKVSISRNSRQQSRRTSAYPGLDKCGCQKKLQDKPNLLAENNDLESHGNPLWLKMSSIPLDAKNKNSDQLLEPAMTTEQMRDQTKQGIAETELLLDTEARFWTTDVKTGNIVSAWDNFLGFRGDGKFAKDSKHNPVSYGSEILQQKTPDSYLELLVESHCSPSPTSSTFQYPEEKLRLGSPSLADQLGFALPTSVEEMEIGGNYEKEKSERVLNSFNRRSSHLPMVSDCPEDHRDIPKIHIDYQLLFSDQAGYSSLNIEMTDIDPTFSQRSFTRQERYEELDVQRARKTANERINTRIKKTLAAMIGNCQVLSASENNLGVVSEASLTYTDAGTVPPKDTKDNARTADTASIPWLDADHINTSLPVISGWSWIIRMGTREKASTSNSEHDSGISWLEEDQGNASDSGTNTESGASTKLSKGRGSTSSLSMISTGAFEGRPFYEGNYSKVPNLEIESAIRHCSKDPLSSWGRTAFPSRPSPSGPVQVNFPTIANSTGHTELYDTRSDAILAIHDKNHGEFDIYCTFDPAIRVIFVHARGTFIPNHEEIEQLGLEILRVPANFNTCINLQLECRLQLDADSAQRRDGRPIIDDAFAADKSETQQSDANGKEMVSLDGRLSLQGAEVYSLELGAGQIVSQCSPTSSMMVSLDDFEWEEEESVFNEDPFLEAQTYSDSENSKPSSDSCRLDSRGGDGILPSEPTPNEPYSAALEDYLHTGGLKLWPSLRIEHIPALESSIPHIRGAGGGISGGSSGKKCTPIESQDIEGYQRLDSLSPEFSDEDFTQKLKEAENQSLQQAIDEIISTQGDNLARGITFNPSIVNLNAEGSNQGDEKSSFKKIPEQIEYCDEEIRTELQEMRKFSYPLEYSVFESPPSLEEQLNRPDQYNMRRKENQTSASEISYHSSMANFGLTAYCNELAEIASNGLTKNEVGATNNIPESSYRVPFVINPCEIPIDATGFKRARAADGLNIRSNGRATPERKNTKPDETGGALVDIFQSYGLMPQNQPTFRGPAALGSSPLKIRANRVPSASSSRTSPNFKIGHSEGTCTSAAKAHAFQRAFSGLSDRSNEIIWGFGELSEDEKDPFW